MSNTRESLLPQNKQSSAKQQQQSSGGQMAPSSTRNKTKPLSVVQALIGECLCPEPFQEGRILRPNAQFIELHGVEFISLGAMVDELTPEQRVKETVEQLLADTERLISIGYLVDDDDEQPEQQSPPPAVVAAAATTEEQQEAPKKDTANNNKDGVNKITETVPLAMWNEFYPNDRNMSRRVSRAIKSIKDKEFASALKELRKDFEAQKAHPNRNINKYLMGISAQNMAVIHVLAGQEDKALPLFQGAVMMKIHAFGEDHLEVALSLDEIGIQLFARKKFQEALDTFNDARKIRKGMGLTYHPKDVMVLNNIGCCHFSMGNHQTALEAFEEARTVQQSVHAGANKADLDLLHEAITICNLGYMKLHLKRYDEAQELFQEALLIQQSVLGDDASSRAIKDTMSNIEFTNAFHSIS